jgi:hypothetical protein
LRAAGHGAAQVVAFHTQSGNSASPQKDGFVRYAPLCPTWLTKMTGPKLVLVALAGWLSACATDAVWAQPKTTKGKTTSGPAGGHGAPSSTVPPGMRPPASKAAGGTTKTGGATAAPAVPVDPATGLPLGYDPKKPPTELMTLEKPLATQEQIAKWKKDTKNLAEYRKALRNADLSPTGKAMLSMGIKYRLALLTLKENQQDLHKLREDLTVRDQTDAASVPAIKPDVVRAFRRWFLEEITKEAEPLLENNFYVRIQAATLLGELVLMPADEEKKQKLETFTPPVDILRKVIRNPDQPLAVKIAAARSMIRLVRYGDLPAPKRFEVMKDVLAELTSPNAKTEPKTHYWYEMRLVEVLSTLDTPLDLETRRPVMVEKLTEIVRDPQRHWHVRAEAAKALGRVPLDPQVNVASLLHDVMQLTLDMAKAAQQNPKAPHWKMTFWKLYLTFQPKDKDERNAAKNAPAGLLKNPSAGNAAQQPYQLVVPLVNAVINSEPITAEHLKAVEDWLQKNKGLAGVASGPTRSTLTNGATATNAAAVGGANTP